jgi:hypothetical protein
VVRTARAGTVSWARPRAAPGPPVVQLATAAVLFAAFIANLINPAAWAALPLLAAGLLIQGLRQSAKPARRQTKRFPALAGVLLAAASLLLLIGQPIAGWVIAWIVLAGALAGLVLQPAA